MCKYKKVGFHKWKCILCYFKLIYFKIQPYLKVVHLRKIILISQFLPKIEASQSLVL